MICANCRAPLRREMTMGQSSLYSPEEDFTLCEPCWMAEQRLIDDEGTNNLPLVLEHYRQNFDAVRKE